mmetsp:Transcript_42382/g.135772  ORF Transcript_42382/g.135772 Transcript_42382/m.135772 type:complete len:291 (+) Transcript_42382:3300-4172(+)
MPRGPERPGRGPQRPEENGPCYGRGGARVDHAAARGCFRQHPGGVRGGPAVPRPRRRPRPGRGHRRRGLGRAVQGLVRGSHRREVRDLGVGRLHGRGHPREPLRRRGAARGTFHVHLRGRDRVHQRLHGRSDGGRGRHHHSAHREQRPVRQPLPPAPGRGGGAGRGPRSRKVPGDVEGAGGGREEERVPSHRELPLHGGLRSHRHRPGRGRRRRGVAPPARGQPHRGGARAGARPLRSSLGAPEVGGPGPGVRGPREHSGPVRQPGRHRRRSLGLLSVLRRGGGLEAGGR